jgi:hypothetical protein
MESIPRPLEFVLDSNDDNLIVSIPDEPIEVDDNKTRDENKEDMQAKRKKSEIYVSELALAVYFFRIVNSLNAREGVSHTKIQNSVRSFWLDKRRQSRRQRGMLWMINGHKININDFPFQGPTC